MNAVELNRLSRKFNGIRAVENLTLSVPPGIIFGFLGPNGAGKTTTIRLLLGLLEPTAGKAAVYGHDSLQQAEKVRALTGSLLEQTGLYEQLSAEDNLEFYGRVYHLAPDQRQRRIRELLDEHGLWEWRKEPVKKWSRGMKQKLALARTLLHQPKLILLDEPTAGLDVAAAVEIRARLAHLVEQGITVFLTTHNMTEAEKLCHQVAVIHKGKLAAAGKPGDLRARFGTQRLEVFGHGWEPGKLEALQNRPEIVGAAAQNGYLYLDLDEKADATAVVRLLVETGMHVQEVHRVHSSLEEVYLTLTEDDKENNL